jgi:HTH-type transcriptional regulator/antitoxin HigA
MKEMLMNIKPIKTKADYRAALRDVDALIGSKRNTADGERLDVLV